MMWMLLLIACASEPWAPPDGPGPWVAGTDEGVVDGDPALPVQVWFPADETWDGVPYLYDDIIEGGVNRGGAPVCGDPRPVLVFSHGNGGIRFQSFFLMEHLASHGWITAAMDHVGNTYLDASLPVGEVAVRRPADVAATFDWLAERSADPADPLFGCVDPGAGYAVAGHSFGGFTALAVAGGTLDLAGLDEACGDGGSGAWLCGAEDRYRALYGDELGDLGDPRVWASVPLSPAGRGALDEGLAEIAVPTLILSGLDDDTTTWDGDVRPLYERLAVTPRHLVGMRRGGHLSFTDFCWVNPGFNGCGADSIDLATAHDLTRTAALAFLDDVRGEERSADWFPVSSEHLVWESVP